MVDPRGALCSPLNPAVSTLKFANFAALRYELPDLIMKLAPVAWAVSAWILPEVPAVERAKPQPEHLTTWILFSLTAPPPRTSNLIMQ